MEKAIKFAKKMKKVWKKVGAALRKLQEEMKRQVNRGQKEPEVWKTEDKVILSMKYLVFKE